MSDMHHDEFLQKFQQLMQEARAEERRRACRIVLEFEVYTPYIVAKQAVQERKEKLIEMIMDGMK